MMTVNKDTWEVWLSLKGSHSCDTELTDVEGWEVHIRRAGAERAPATVPNNCAPCGIKLPATSPIQRNSDVLIYPVLDADGDRICIFFDSLIHKQPSGYYTAEVYNKERTRLTTFMLHIPTEAYRVTDTQTIPLTAC